MTFNTHYKRNKFVGEKNNGKYIVEIGTYQSSEKLIKSFINAGQVVAGSRKMAYDFEDGEDDGRPVDVSRQKNFDMADASIILNDLEARAKERTVEKVSEKADTKQKSSEVPNNGTETVSPTPEKTE